MTFEEAKRYLLERAAALGVELELLASETRELTIDAYDASLGELKQASRGGVGLRIVHEGRTGYAWSEELTREALDWTLDEAIENAGMQSDMDDHLPEGQSLGRRDLLSEGLSAELREKAQRALDLERALRADPRFRKLMLARYTEREVQEALASTRGADASYRSGFAALGASFVLGEGESVKQGWDFDAAREFHALDPQRTSQEMLHATGRLLGAEPLKTGRYRAFLEPKVVSDLLQVLSYALSGKTLVEGKSRFDGKLGERVAAAGITLVDDPTLPDGLASRPFDSEGTPAKRVVLIEDGVLRSFLHNATTARRTGHENTGHAERSYRGTLEVGTTNLHLLPGSGVEAREGVIVTEVMGLHAGANPITGDISLQALGLLVEGGETRPVENFVISGNLFEMLERVVGLGSEIEWSFSGRVSGAPTVEIDWLSFGGA